MTKFRLSIISLCLLTVVAIIPSVVIPDVVPTDIQSVYSSTSEAEVHSIFDTLPSPSNISPPPPALTPVLMWSPTRTSMYVSDEEFYSLADTLLGEAADGLSNRDIFYFVHAFLLGDKYHDFSDHISTIAMEIAQREAPIYQVDDEWIYLCDAALSVISHAIVNAQDPATYGLSVLYWIEGLITAYVDGDTYNDNVSFAHIAALMQTVIKLVGDDDNGFLDIDYRSLILCRASADWTAQSVIDRANLGIGLPLWFTPNYNLRLSDQSWIGLFLARYQTNGGAVKIPYTNIQLEATFDSFRIEDARPLHPGEFFEYSYWIYRTDEPYRYDKPDIHTIAAIAAANTISGRVRLTRFAVLEILDREEMHSAAALYAFAYYLYG